MINKKITFISTTILLSFVVNNLVQANTLGEIIWFNANSPFERKNQETHLEWDTRGGTGANIFIRCERGKIELFNPAQGGQTYSCGTLLQYTVEESASALVLFPKGNKEWTKVEFEMYLVDNEGFTLDQKSFSIGFKPVKYTFDQNLYFGMKNHDGVLALQQFLTEQKFYKGPITGNFLAMTLSAVKGFQKKNNIKDTGFVGQLTRLKLNK